MGGTALLADHLTSKERSRTQVLNDLLIGLLKAIGSLSSSVVFASMGFTIVNVVGMVFVLVIFAVSVWWRLRLVVETPGHKAL